MSRGAAQRRVRTLVSDRFQVAGPDHGLAIRGEAGRVLLGPVELDRVLKFSWLCVTVLDLSRGDRVVHGAGEDLLPRSIPPVVLDHTNASSCEHRPIWPVANHAAPRDGFDRGP